MTFRFQPSRREIGIDVVASTESNLEFSFESRTVEPGLIPPLVAALDNEDVKHRRVAAWLLTHQNAAQHPNFLDQEQLATVLKRLDDEDGFVREYVLELLERFPPQAPEAMTELVKVLIDEHGINSFRAAGILAQLAPQSLPAVRRAASSENSHVRLGAAMALGSMKPFPATEIPLLISLTRDPVPDVRRYAGYSSTVKPPPTSWWDCHRPAKNRGGGRDQRRLRPRTTWLRSVSRTTAGAWRCRSRRVGLTQIQNRRGEPIHPVL